MIMDRYDQFGNPTIEVGDVIMNKLILEVATIIDIKYYVPPVGVKLVELFSVKYKHDNTVKTDLPHVYLQHFDKVPSVSKYTTGDPIYIDDIHEIECVEFPIDNDEEEETD